MKRNFSKPGESRLVQVKRMFAIAMIFTNSRRSFLSLESVREQLNDRMGESWSERTIRRDLHGLQELGLIESVRNPFDPATHYRWSGKEEHSRLAFRFAERERELIPTKPSPPLAIYLRWLPAPWNLTERQIGLAKDAARLIAVMTTGDRNWLTGELRFDIGNGWSLDVDAEPQVFDQVNPLDVIAGRYVKNADRLLSA